MRSCRRDARAAGECAKTRRIVLTGGTYDEIYTARRRRHAPYVTDGLDWRPDDPAEIDNYRDNWWCAWGERDAGDSGMAAGGGGRGAEGTGGAGRCRRRRRLARRAVELAQATPGRRGTGSRCTWRYGRRGMAAA
jgi:hypothetical protein